MLSPSVVNVIWVVCVCVTMAVGDEMMKVEVRPTADGIDILFSTVVVLLNCLPILDINELTLGIRTVAAALLKL